MEGTASGSGIMRSGSAHTRFVEQRELEAESVGDSVGTHDRVWRMLYGEFLSEGRKGEEGDE
jgi:hypothetical protein